MRGWACLGFIFWLILEPCGPLLAQQPDSVVVSYVNILGNEKTKHDVLIRELPVDKGQKIHLDDLPTLKSEMQRNLMNTGLFNFVHVFDSITENRLGFWIHLEERWYLWPNFYVDYADRNINNWWKKKDWHRVNYKFGLVQNNFRGRREEIGVQAQLGYEHEFAFLYDIPFLNQKKTIGMKLMADYQALRHVAYGSIDHRLLFVSDPSRYLYQKSQISLSMLYRPDIHTIHQLTGAVYQYSNDDTLLALNKDFAAQNQDVFPYFSYIFKLDYRDYKHYPLNGYYVDFAARKFGLPGLSVDYFLLKTYLRKYFQLFPQQWYFASGLVAQTHLGKDLPYHLIANRGLGYERDFVRGLEYYVFDQTDWVYLKTSLKRKILPQQIVQIGFLKNQLFGEKFSKIPLEIFGTAFYDAGYVGGNYQQQETNPMVDLWIQGAGFGLEFVTYYDKVLRTEVSWNQRGEIGFFLHMIAPI